MIDFKNFKKVQEDDKVATMRNDSGHEIKIAKSSLSPDLHARLKALPLHQAHGTKAEDYEAPKEDAPEPDKTMPSGGHTINIFGGSQPGLPDQQPPGPTPPLSDDTAVDPKPDSTGPSARQPPSMAAMNPDPYMQQTGPSSQVAPMQQLPEFALGQAAAKGQMGATQEAGASVAAATDKFQKDMAASAMRTQADMAAKQKEIDAAVADIKANHIQPNHYLESKGVAGKITTALGLMLGGMGAGLTHGPNMAQQFLQSQIERDLEAQKANLGSKENLLSALGQQYKNIGVRDEMFRDIRAQTMSAELQGIAAKNNVNMATPQYQQTLSNLIGPARQTLQKASLLDMQSQAEGQAPGAVGDQSAQRYLQTARVLDPKAAEEFEKRYIPSVGVAGVPLDPKDREFLQKNTELRDLYKQAQSVLSRNSGFGAIPYTANHAEAKSIQNQMQLKMGELASLSRFTPEENKIYQQTVPDLAGTHFTNQDKAKMDSMMKSVDDKLNVFYQQKGVGRQAGDADTIKVISPSGQSGSIPKANLSKALQSGYRQVK